jgi:hypothetical protein
MSVDKVHTQEKLFTSYSLSESKDHQVLLIWFFGREFSFGSLENSKWTTHSKLLQASTPEHVKKLTWKLQLEPYTFYFHDAHM